MKTTFSFSLHKCTKLPYIYNGGADMSRYKVDLPYPPIQINGVYPEYGYMLLSNIGSSNSEVNAVSLYTYNKIITSPGFKEISDTFHAISIVEMHHLDIFSQFCLLEGVDPRWWSCDQGNFEYWSPQFHAYPKELSCLLKYAIQGEQDAIKKYQQQAAIICDENIVKMLERIILDEQHHVELLNNLLCKYCG